MRDEPLLDIRESTHLETQPCWKPVSIAAAYGFSSQLKAAEGLQAASPRGSGLISSRGCRQALVLPAVWCGVWVPRHLALAAKLSGRLRGGLGTRLATGDPVHSVRCGPGACCRSRAPRGWFSTRLCARRECLPARPFLHFPGKARLWEGRVGGGSWPPAPSGTGTLGNLCCASAWM